MELDWLEEQMLKLSKLEEENKELKEELIEAYEKRGELYMGGEKEWINKRIEELKNN